MQYHYHQHAHAYSAHARASRDGSISSSSPPINMYMRRRSLADTLKGLKKLFCQFFVFINIFKNPLEFRIQKLDRKSLIIVIMIIFILIVVSGICRGFEKSYFDCLNIVRFSYFPTFQTELFCFGCNSRPFFVSKTFPWYHYCSRIWSGCCSPEARCQLRLV